MAGGEGRRAAVDGRGWRLSGFSSRVYLPAGRWLGSWDRRGGDVPDGPVALADIAWCSWRWVLDLDPSPMPRPGNGHIASWEGCGDWLGAHGAGWPEVCCSVPVEDGGCYRYQHTDAEKPREHFRSSTRTPGAASASLVSLPRVFLMRRHVGISGEAVVFLTDGSARSNVRWTVPRPVSA